MSRKSKIDTFDPNGISLDNGHFIGLPFTEAEAQIVLMSVPWDVTASYAGGTSGGPENILQASLQLDLYDPAYPDAWKMGLFMRPPSQKWQATNGRLRPMAEKYISFLEEGGDVKDNWGMRSILEEINAACAQLHEEIKAQSKALLDAGKLVGLIGGEHSVPLGYLQALAKQHDDFGILQIDAHFDLREAYEGFSYSHASIFKNVLALPQISKLVPIGIRDYCHEEVEVVAESEGRIHPFYDHDIHTTLYTGGNWHQLCQAISDALPKKIYISFDVDGLSPELCPNTGTPVPGGLRYEQAIYLIDHLVTGGHQIIGFDLCEVAGRPHEWDGNVGARLAYRLVNFMGKSNGL
jgi:agmatinase